jgi:phosphohistidine phosphatase SixA
MTQELERDLRILEAEAERSGPGEAAHVLNRAGDLCLGAGDRERALSYYGRAIDASLVARRYNAAAGLCRKILRVVPTAVRTRCTLAWLALGRGDAPETTREIAAYVDASVEAGQQALAVAHLRMMAETTGVPAIRGFIADRLLALGQAGAAQAVRRTIPADSSPGPVDSEHQEQLWRSVVNAALLSPEDVGT